MSRPSVRAAPYPPRPPQRARVAALAELRDLDAPLRARPQDVRQLVRQAEEQVSMEAPMWTTAPREVCHG